MLVLEKRQPPIVRPRSRAQLRAVSWAATADTPRDEGGPLFPGQPSTGRSQPAKRTSRGAPRTCEQTVLVVDDESAVRLILRVNLEASGHRVLEAADGAQAIALAKAERPDLILLDVMMPKVDGFTVAETLAADPTTAALPIVFLSARTGSREFERAHDLGAVGYVTKPFEPLQLTHAVTAFLDRLARGELDELRREFRADMRRA